MSHIATVQIEFTSLSSLKAACRDLGLEFHENRTSFKWYGSSSKCDHMISTKDKNAYQIGVTESSNGSYSLSFDSWQGGYGLEAAAGKDLCKLTQHYAKHQTRRELLSKGLTLESNTVKDGTIQMVFVGHR